VTGVEKLVEKVLAPLFAVVLREGLNFMAARADFKAAVTAKIVARGNEQTLAALDYLVRATRDPRGLSDLRVQPGAASVPSEGADPHDGSPRIPS
jgi:hypothetical protein